MAVAASQLQEKCLEQYTDLYSTYVDLTKAFDTVSREGLWRIMAKYGCPGKFIAIIHQFHDGMLARVKDNGETSATFSVSNGVKQGFVLDSTLLSLMFSAMLTDNFRHSDVGIGTRKRYDGSLFNLRRRQTETRVALGALNAASKVDMQHSVGNFSDACNNNHNHQED